MSYLHDKLETIKLELLKFSNTVLEIGSSIQDNRIEKFENEINQKLPVDFKYFLTEFNGFSLMSTKVFGLGDHYQQEALDKIYYFEHSEIENKMPSFFIPFSNDGRGNHYCLDLSRMDENMICPVIFWQWDFKYINMNNVETCNESFNEWVMEVMIEWTLEEYTYEGEEK